MDLSSRLILFLEVSEKGSFAKVAEFRKIDRSVISKQVAKLESELGVRLLNRSTRSFSLTAAGIEMVRKAKELRALLNDTSRIAENYHIEPKGLLRITSSAALAQQILHPVIIEFQRRYPHVVVDLQLSDRLVDIVGEAYDLAFRIGEPRDSSLIARRLARNRLAILASPEYIHKYGTPKTIEKLQEMPAAGYLGEGLRADVIKFCNDENEIDQIKMNCIFHSNDIDILMKNTLSGGTYYVAPAFQIMDQVKSGKLIPIMTNLKLLDYAGIYAVFPHRDLTIRTRLFLDAVIDFIGEETPVWEDNIPGFSEMYDFQNIEKWGRGRN
jgi:DNA-binding transcriptional LysR family regulator